MPKGVEKQQLANAGTADNLSNQLTSNGANIYGSLEPQLAASVAHPAGYTPAQKAAINTSAQQSAGGSTAGAVGEGGLYAARTRNAGAAQSAIGASDRAAGGTLSRAAVGTQVQDANLAQANKNRALGGMQGLYGTEESGGEHALDTSNPALAGAAQSADANPWMKLLLQGMQSGGQVGAAAVSPAGA